MANSQVDLKASASTQWIHAVSKSFVFGLGMAVLFIVGLAGYFLWQSQKTLHEKAANQAGSLARVIGQYAYSALHESDVFLLSYVDDYRNAVVGKHYNPAQFIKEIEADLRHHPSILNVRIADANGDIWYGDNAKRLAKPINITDRAYFAKARDNDQLAISVPVLGKISQELVIPIARRLQDGNGKFAGMIVANLHATGFTDLFASLKLGKKNTYLFFDPETNINLRYPEPKGLGSAIGLKIGSPQFKELWWKQGVHASTYRAQSTTDGIWRTYSYRQIGDYPYYVMAGVAEDNTLAPWRLHVLVTTGFVGVFLLLVAYLFWSQVRDGINRKLGEQAYKRASLYARSLIEASLDPLVTICPDGKITDVNNATEAVTGRTRLELIGSDFSNYFTDPDSARVGYQKVFSEGSVTDFPLTIRHASGKVIDVLYNASVYRSEAGEVEGVFAAARDITERKHAEEEIRTLNLSLEKKVHERTTELKATNDELRNAKESAEAASNAKSTFLANMSHELRTPMNAIMGMTNLALRHAEDPKLKDQLGKIDAASKHLLHVINDILDISKIEAERLTLEHTPFRLGEVIENLMSLIGLKATEKGLKFYIDQSPGLPALSVTGDPMRLGQVLLNLASNAVKFTQSGSVTLRSRVIEETSDELLLRWEIADTGIGIAADDQNKLFTAFEQADGSMTRMYGGTGLGLAISKRLVEMMGGEIGLESESGKGSTFWFTVRLKKSGPTDALLVHGASTRAADEQLLDRHAGARVLLAEDEPVNQEVSRGLLEDAGLLVDLAEDGQAALDLARQNPYALILMDMQMPNLNGLDATKAIRTDSLNKGTPILAMTANAFDEDRQLCLDAGMNDHIGKPINSELLYETLLHWLEKGTSE